MAGCVRGQFLFDTAQVSNLFQVTVHLLIAGNGQQSSFIHAVGAVSYTHLDVYKRQGLGGAR